MVKYLKKQGRQGKQGKLKMKTITREEEDYYIKTKTQINRVM